MQTLDKPSTSLVATVVRDIATFYPDQIRQQIEAALPTLTIEAFQLAAEVLHAEQVGLMYAQAIVHPNYPKMERVYFGLMNTLQWRLPPEVEDALSAMLTHSDGGGFDPMRRDLFATAARENDPEAALCRFFIWLAVRVNLLVLTWEVPQVEALGTLDAMDVKAETVMREYLVEAATWAVEVRPLHVLVAEMFLHTTAAVRKKVRAAIEEYGAELTEIGVNANALAEARALDAKDAVVFMPGRFAGPPGSTQIMRRYPQHYASANAVEQRRHRLRARRRPSKTPDGVPRLIDLVQAMGDQKKVAK